MKKFAILLALSMIASSAFALVDDGTSSLGLYFNETGDVNCSAPPPFVPFSAYIIVANPEVANMGGFEFAWRFSPPASPLISAFVLPPQALNIGDFYNVIVGLGSGLITSEATVLARIDMVVLAAFDPQTYVQMGPATPASHPGHAAYIDFANPAMIIDMNFSTVDGVENTVGPDGWVSPGVAKMSCPGPVATDSQTWSGVKALFE